MMNFELIEIKSVMPNEIEIAWDILLANYGDYIEKYSSYNQLPKRMTYEEFENLYNEYQTAFYFVTHDSKNIGTFYVINEDNYNINLARIWMTPTYNYNGIIPIVVKRFESTYKEAKSLTIGDCQLNQADIEECKEDGWQVTSLIERMSDGLIIARLEKHSA